jgi:hypothetical protein
MAWIELTLAKIPTCFKIRYIRRVSNLVCSHVKLVEWFTCCNFWSVSLLDVSALAVILCLANITSGRFEVAKLLLTDYDVIREARFEWLGCQRIDIFIPALAVAMLDGINPPRRALADWKGSSDWVTVDWRLGSGRPTFFGFPRSRMLQRSW